jgi:N-acyl-D-aspartate/D-glutamate deacylase
VHDLVIDNAVVIDGLGGPARPGGVAVAQGRIVAVGTDLGGARTRVDAGGLVLAPGIVDLHTHYDAQLTWDPFATPSPALGATTVVIGNCGFTIAPCRPADRDLTLRNLTHVEGMSLEAMRRGDLTLEEAVKRVTSDVARAYRIRDRGRLAPGAWADLLLFDPRTVGRGPKRPVRFLSAPCRRGAAGTASAPAPGSG